MQHHVAQSRSNPLADRLAINGVWLMKLRWVAIAGQLATIVVVGVVYQIEIPFVPLLFSLGITAVSNGIFTRWLQTSQRLPPQPQRSVNEWTRVFLTLMLLDLMVLTALLFLTGGHANPFGLFYFVNLALSGMLLPPGRAWLLNGLSIGCFAALFFFQIPLEALRQPERLLSVRESGVFPLAQQGLFVAFSVCSSVIVYFVTRLTSELQCRDEALRRSEWRQARSDKWEALGTLAAGAAHELATPLTTIAVISREIEREIRNQGVHDSLVADVRVIRQELDRCRGILDQMSTDAGHLTAETGVQMDAGELGRRVLEGLSLASQRVRLNVPAEVAIVRVQVPPFSVCMAIRGMVHNALDASGEAPVELTMRATPETLCIEVRDYGSGMEPEVLDRADEPFFSTKEAGRGMGLGRFLTKTVVERLGGTFLTDSSPGQGTLVTIELPRLERTGQAILEQDIALRG
jgi:two-component system sensor histidine kinase RegB